MVLVGDHNRVYAKRKMLSKNICVIRMASKHWNVFLKKLLRNRKVHKSTYMYIYCTIYGRRRSLFVMKSMQINQFCQKFTSIFVLYIRWLTRATHTHTYITYVEWVGRWRIFIIIHKMILHFGVSLDFADFVSHFVADFDSRVIHLFPSHFCTASCSSSRRCLYATMLHTLCIWCVVWMESYWSVRVG